MSGETVQIALVGGPLDGETYAIPAAEAGKARRYVPPRPPSILDMWSEPGTIPESPKHLVYRPMTADFAGWPMPSVMDDGVMRYRFAGESW